MTQTTPPARQPGRADELDGLRGLLALWVVLSHLFCWTGFWEFTAPGPLRHLWAEFIGAEPAVETFIILSGFAISFLIHKRRESYGQFMWGRFFRIYPVYFACLALGTATALLLTPFVLQTAGWRDTTVYFEWNRSLSAAETSATGPHVFWHVTLLHGVIPRSMLGGVNATLLTPAWSISLEWQYYLVAPLLARLVRSGLGLALLAAVAWVALGFADRWMNPHLAFLPAQLPLFLIGIGSFHLYRWFGSSGSRRSRVFALPAVAVAALGILTGWHPTPLLMWALAFGCIFVEGDDPLSRAFAALRAVLNHRWLQWLGRISYSLYLVHWPAIIACLALMLYLRPELSSQEAILLLLSIGLPLILVAATIMHVSLERPMMAWGARWIAARQQSANATAPSDANKA